MNALSEPQRIYSERLRAREEALAREEKRDEQVANVRLVIFVLALAMVVLIVTTEAFGWLWLSAPAVAFLVLVVWHDRILRDKDRAAQAVSFYRRALSRLDGTWPGQGVTGEDLPPEEHPYAPDLDLFGKGSLFELLCTARTRAGENTLADWLLAPADPNEVRARQAAVAELRDRVDLREELALLGGAVQAQTHPKILTKWGEAATPFPNPKPTLVVASLLTMAALVSVVLWATTPLGPVPLLGVVVVEVLLGRLWKNRILQVVEAIQKPIEELRVLAQLLERWEKEPVSAPWLVARRDTLTSDGVLGSQQIARLVTRVTWLDAMRNQFFFPIGFMLMWSVHFGLAVERWRLAHGPRIRGWLSALGELEALCALAGYHFDHPEDPFPKLVEGKARLQGEALAHPLMVTGECVPNDVTLNSESGPSVWVVSGSNMSGKSTLLRTVGINVVLAQAGAPVRAQSLTLTPLQPGATLRVNDSLADGRSRFYAEISRLRNVVALTEQNIPVLFLLDEILHGTNSHDRQIGAQAVVQGLIDAGAIGLVTTHDLALAQAANNLGVRARNVHFVDELKDGHLHFDYRLREGVVQKSNALELMRSVGLVV